MCGIFFDIPGGNLWLAAASLSVPGHGDSPACASLYARIGISTRAPLGRRECAASARCTLYRYRAYNRSPGERRVDVRSDSCRRCGTARRGLKFSGSPSPPLSLSLSFSARLRFRRPRLDDHGQVRFLTDEYAGSRYLARVDRLGAPRSTPKCYTILCVRCVFSRPTRWVKNVMALREVESCVFLSKRPD